MLQVQLVELCFVRQLLLDLPVHQLLASLNFAFLRFIFLVGLNWLIGVLRCPLTRNFRQSLLVLRRNRSREPWRRLNLRTTAILIICVPSMFSFAGRTTGEGRIAQMDDVPVSVLVEEGAHVACRWQ